MTDAAEAAEAEDRVDDAAENDAPDFEDRATRMGWRPQAEFKGDPDKWVDAKTFVERGEQILPIVQANNRQLEKALEATRKEVATLKGTLKEFADHHSKTEQRAFERALRELQTEQARLAAEGDVDGVRDVTKQIIDLNKEVKAPQPVNHEDPLASPEFQEKFEAWQEENPWFESDPDLKAYAMGLGQRLANEGMAPEKQLKEVAKRVRATFPQKFENARRKAPAAVEGDNNAPRKAGKTRADLPREARDAMDRFVKQGLVTEAQYIKEYFA